MQSTLRAAFLPRADYWRFLGTSWVLLLRPKPSPLWSPNCPFWEAFRGPWVPHGRHAESLGRNTGALSILMRGTRLPGPWLCKHRAGIFQKELFVQKQKKTEAGVLAGITFLTHAKLASMCRAGMWIWVPMPASHLSLPLTHPGPLSHPWPSPWSSFSCN